MYVQVCGGGEAGASGASNRGGFGRDGWVRIGNVTPFSCGVLSRVISAPASSVGSS